MLSTPVLMRYLRRTRGGGGIVTSGLVMHLDAGNAASYPGSGTAWTDLSGNGNNGTLVGGPTYSATNGGQIVFDGVNDRLDDITLPNPNAELTFEIAMNYTSQASYHNIMDRSGNAGGTLYPQLWVRPSSLSNRLEVNAGNLVADTDYSGTSIIAALGIRSGATPGIELYINGVLHKTTTAAQPSWPNPVAMAFFNRVGGQTFLGSAAILRWYNRALSASEVLQNFNVNKARFGL